MQRNRTRVLLLWISLLVAMTGVVLAQHADVKIIEDVAAWKHPVKKVFQKQGIVLEKVELRNKEVYPVFYVKLPYDPHIARNDRYFHRLYRAVLKANGYWDYELVSRVDDVRIRIAYDRKTKTMSEDLVSLDEN